MFLITTVIYAQSRKLEKIQKQKETKAPINFTFILPNLHPRFIQQFYPKCSHFYSKLQSLLTKFLDSVTSIYMIVWTRSKVFLNSISIFCVLSFVAQNEILKLNKPYQTTKQLAPFPKHHGGILFVEWMNKWINK